MKKDYYRVIPRDLFNEAKLLKCIGKLCLLIHDRIAPIEVSFNDDHFKPFKICQNENDGGLFISNLVISINNKRQHFQTIYNSKDEYPLFLVYNNIDYRVFNNNGSLHEEFLTIIKSI